MLFFLKWTHCWCCTMFSQIAKNNCILRMCNFRGLNITLFKLILITTHLYCTKVLQTKAWVKNIIYVFCLPPSHSFSISNSLSRSCFPKLFRNLWLKTLFILFIKYIWSLIPRDSSFPCNESLCFLPLQWISYGYRNSVE